MIFLTIGLLMLMSAMLPGPDFALVTKNTVLYSRLAGIYTSFGIASAVLIHISYSALGLAIIISQSLLLFSIIKYLGATYLIFLGIKTLLAKNVRSKNISAANIVKSDLPKLVAWRQGFFCNLLNPKAAMFFVAIFTMVIKPGTSGLIEVLLIVEMFIVVFTWFSSLTLLLSHPKINSFLTNSQFYIAKTMGVFLIGFGIALALIRK